MPKKKPTEPGKGNKSTGVRRRRIFFLALLCLMVVSSLVVGSCLWIHASRHRVVSFHSVRVDDELYAYWQARFRYEYLTAHAAEGAVDTEAFWSSVKDPETGLTWGQDCENTTRMYIERLMIASHLFDAQGYTVDESYRANMQSVLVARLNTAVFGSSVETYNSLAAPYGFTYEAAEKALVHEVKAALLSTYATADQAQQLAYYTQNYVRVKMIFISDQHENREDILGAIRLSIQGGITESDFDNWVTDSFYNDNPGAQTTYAGGYYLCPDASFTEELSALLPPLTEAALGLEIGETVEITVTQNDYNLDEGVTLEGFYQAGTYFLYRSPLPDTPAYEVEANQSFFTNLTRIAANHYFTLWIDSYLGQPKWREENIPALPYQGRDSKLYLFF